MHLLRLSLMAKFSLLSKTCKCVWKNTILIYIVFVHTHVPSPLFSPWSVAGSLEKQCATKFSSNAGKVQRVEWQAGKNIGKMNCEYSGYFSLSLLWTPRVFSAGTGEINGGLAETVQHTGGDEVGRISCWELKRQQGLWTSCFF